jgi:hypothetical protein
MRKVVLVDLTGDEIGMLLEWGLVVETATGLTPREKSLGARLEKARITTETPSLVRAKK